MTIEIPNCEFREVIRTNGRNDYAFVCTYLIELRPECEMIRCESNIDKSEYGSFCPRMCGDKIRPGRPYYGMDKSVFLERMRSALRDSPICRSLGETYIENTIFNYVKKYDKL